jgi:hypothetical protein
MKASPPFQDTAVAEKFATFPEPARTQLLNLRRLIFETAAALPEVGKLEETLKWGQPAYLTPQTKSGSTIRLGLPKQGGFALYAHCQTTILSEFQSIFPHDFSYEGNRAVLFTADKKVDLEKVRLLVHRALTYHLKR